MREIHDRSKPNCFELFATGGADIIKACKTDSEGKVTIIVINNSPQSFISIIFIINLIDLGCRRQTHCLPYVSRY